jgi:NodT family efflux transporter outer membrane factor (OMF) lipoprotein
LDGKADVQREKFSPAAFGGSAGSGSIFTLYDVSASVSYALDLFGGVRRGIEAQAAQAEYQQFQTLATYQTLAANVVTSAVKEASLRAQLGATNKVIEALQEQLQLTERQAELGGAAYAEVLTARSNLASVQATVPGLQQQQSAAQHQLAVYLGKTPSEFTSSGLELAALRLPQEIPVSLPSELVRQRPDVRAAEASLHQASAEVGVATANLLPQISISGSYGGQANKSSDLFSSGASVWNIGAGITQPLFHAGELTARRRAAIAAYDQAAANYRLTVLQAFQNVADSLRALDNDAQALAAQYTAAGSAEESLRLLQKQYELGGASYLQLLTAQKQYQQTQIDYVRALAARYQDTAALFQALGGGGWAEATTTASTR